MVTNYVNGGKCFLSRPLLQWKKMGKILEKFIRVEQASEYKKINFVQCKIKNLLKTQPNFRKYERVIYHKIMYTSSKIEEKYIEMKSGNEKLILCRPSFLVNNGLHTFWRT